MVRHSFEERAYMLPSLATRTQVNSHAAYEARRLISHARKINTLPALPTRSPRGAIGRFLQANQVRLLKAAPRDAQSVGSYKRVAHLVEQWSITP